MASQHRKPRSAVPRVAGIRTPALATAALTSVALLSQSANAAPSEDDGRPSLEEVEKKVDDLYRQAESATEKYNAAKEKTPAKQRKRAGSLLDDVAQRTQKLNGAREELGSHAAAQYRTGSSVPDTATFLLAESPQDPVDRTQPMNRVTGRQKSTVDDYVTEQPTTMSTRREAAESLASRDDAQSGLRTAKATVQKKLADARGLMSRLTAQEKARLAAIEKRHHEEAARRAAEPALRQAAARTAARQDGGGAPASTGATTDTGTGTATHTRTASHTGTASHTRTATHAGTGAGSPSASASAPAPASPADPSYGAKAGKALAFARAQIGKPYVWGAMGPGSYDCSGLTQAAWKAAGVILPRTAYDQVKAGATVSSPTPAPATWSSSTTTSATSASTSATA